MRTTIYTHTHTHHTHIECIPPTALHTDINSKLIQDAIRRIESKSHAVDGLVDGKRQRKMVLCGHKSPRQYNGTTMHDMRMCIYVCNVCARARVCVCV